MSLAVGGGVGVSEGTLEPDGCPVGTEEGKSEGAIETVSRTVGLVEGPREGAIDTVSATEGEAEGTCDVSFPVPANGSGITGGVLKIEFALCTGASVRHAMGALVMATGRLGMLLLIPCIMLFSIFMGLLLVLCGADVVSDNARACKTDCSTARFADGGLIVGSLFRNLPVGDCTFGAIGVVCDNGRDGVDAPFGLAGRCDGAPGHVVGVSGFLDLRLAFDGRC